jgi:hypothetical protein
VSASCALLLLLALGPAPSQAAPSGRDEIRNKAREILSSPEYDASKPDAAAPDAMEWIIRKIREVLAQVSALGANSPAFYWGMLLVCALVLAAIFGHAGWALVRSLRAARSVAPRADGERTVFDDPRTLLRNAEEAAATGRFVDAIRLCHRAAHPRDRQGYDEIVRIYEPAYFGRVAAGAEQFRACRTAAEALIAEARG